MTDLVIHVNGSAPGKVYDATLGERLTFSVTCSKGSLEGTTWQISGTSVCGDFRMEKQRSAETLATMGHSPTASWCMACTGQARVTVRAQVLGRTLDAEVRVNVSGPKVLSFDAETDDIHIARIDSGLTSRSALYLTFGGLKSTRKPGITWTARLLGAPAKAGRYAFVQLMKIDRKRLLRGRLLDHGGGNSAGEWVLDEDVFYGTSECTDPRFGQPDGEAEDFVVAQWPRESTMIRGEDSPATPLFGEMPKEERFQFDEVEVDEAFRTYLMFRPNEPDDSIWVSIARLDWHWKAHVKFERGEWRFLHKEFDVDPVAEKEIDLPRWANNRDSILRG